MIKAPPTLKGSKVAVFIDAANFEISLKQSKLWAAPLVWQLQKRGIYTTIISPGWRTAKELRKQTDEFIELKDCDFVVKKAP